MIIFINNWINRLLSEENNFPGTLFVAGKVAGSATYKQSKTIRTCVVVLSAQFVIQFIMRTEFFLFTFFRCKTAFKEDSEKNFLPRTTKCFFNVVILRRYLSNLTFCHAEMFFVLPLDAWLNSSLQVSTLTVTYNCYRVDFICSLWIYLLPPPGLAWVGSKFATRDRCCRTWPDRSNIGCTNTGTTPTPPRPRRSCWPWAHIWP